MAHLVRLAVATVLLCTGLIHASQPYLFIHAVAAYQILPVEAAGVAGLILPYFHIILAICIFSRIAERVAFGLSAVIFAVYACAQGFVLVKGISIDCGCFGYSRTPITWQSAVVPTFLAAAAAMLTVSSIMTPRKIET